MLIDYFIFIFSAHTGILLKFVFELSMYEVYVVVFVSIIPTCNLELPALSIIYLI